MSSEPASRSGAETGVARYLMIGGFLGAGKTTAVDWFARELAAAGTRVGLITNDQSTGLVDTRLLASHGHAVEEIAGGCFCCRFDSLQKAAGALEERSAPEVFLAEPVGSCTDLVATVSYPLRRIYGERFVIAPLSVVVDPRRAQRVLGLVDGRSFSDKVVYVYEKQLEEADLIVINKRELLDTAELTALEAALRERFPHADVIAVSAKTGAGMADWLARVSTGESATRPTMPVDYDVYAEGEARLGWLNATLTATAAEPFDANELVVRLAAELRARAIEADAEIAHLKATLDGGSTIGALSVVSVVGNDDEPDLRESLVDVVERGELVLNLRAETDPDALLAWTRDVIAGEAAREGGVTLTLDHEEHFRPAYPTPTHRVVV